MRRLIPSSNRRSFISFFQICLSYIHFSCLVAMAVSSSNNNVNDESGRLAFFLILGDEQSIQSFTIENDVNCVMCVVVLYQVQEVLPMSIFLREVFFFESLMSI